MSEFSPEEAAALKGVFREQAAELLETYSRHVLKLESSSKPGEGLKALQRVVHTIKGDSMALEFDELAGMAHRVEDLLVGLRDEEKPVGQTLVDLLLACGDAMSDLLAAYCAVPPRPPTGHETLLRRLDATLEALHSPDAASRTRRYRLAVTFSPDCRMRSVGTFLIRQRLEPLVSILNAKPDSESPAIENSHSWVLEIETAVSKQAIKRAARVPGVTSRVSLRARKEALVPVGSGGRPETTPCHPPTRRTRRRRPPAISCAWK